MEPDPQLDPRLPRALAVALAVTGLVFVAPVWLFDPLPIQDLPLHEQIVAVLVHGRDWTGFADHLGIDPTPRPYAVAYFLWAALGAVVGVTAASKLLLSYAVLGWLAAGSALVRTCDPAKRWRSLLVGVFLFHEFYYMGVVPFLVGLPTGLWLIARWARRCRGDAPASRRQRLGDGGLLLVTYLIHPGAGLVTGIALLAFLLTAPQPRRRALELFAVGGPSLAWTVALLALAPPYHHRFPVVELAWNSAQGTVLGLVTMPVNAYGSLFFWRAGSTTALLGWLLVGAWILGVLASVPGEAPAERGPARRPVAAALALALTYYVAFPYAWQVGTMLCFRALPLIFLWSLALLPRREEGRPARLLVCAALALTATAAWLAHWQGSRELRPLEPILAVMEPGQAAIPPGVRGRSQVIQGAKLRLLEHAAARYHARKGGLGPQGLIYFSVSPVVVRDWLPDPAERPLDYRYFVSLDGELPPAGFHRIPIRGTGRWALFERDR
jgi:hypothetical protein